MKEKILKFNKKFVEDKEYEKFTAGKYPELKIAILTCMDTRLVELIPAALGIKNGDVKMIKNAGAVVSSSFGSAIRSLLIAIYDLGVNEIMVIGHTDCGACSVNSDNIIQNMLERGITKEQIDMIRYCGVDLENWLAGEDTVEGSVIKNVETLKEHPLIPKDVRIDGYVINTITGELVQVTN